MKISPMLLDPKVIMNGQRLLPFPKRQILDSSNLKEFTDGNFRYDECGKMFFKRKENTVRGGEIALYEQFSPFLAVFSKDLYCRHVKTRAFLGKG